MTERWPTTKRYRDAFEAIKRAVLSLIAEDKHKPRKAIPEIAADVRTTLRGIDADIKEHMNSNDLEHMIGDITGEHLSFWNDVDMNLDEMMNFELDRVDIIPQNLFPPAQPANAQLQDTTSDWINTVDDTLPNSAGFGW